MVTADLGRRCMSVTAPAPLSDDEVVPRPASPAETLPRSHQSTGLWELLGDALRQCFCPHEGAGTSKGVTAPDIGAAWAPLVLPSAIPLLVHRAVTAQM